jgi:hypothetical protein
MSLQEGDFCRLAVSNVRSGDAVCGRRMGDRRDAGAVGPRA